MPRNEDVTTKFKVDISEFKSNIKEANNIIKLANAEFKAATSGMDDWRKSTDGINAKLEQLNKVLDAQKQKLNSYKQQFEELNKAEQENGRRAEELKSQYDDAVQTFGKNSQEAKRLATALNQVEQEQERNKTAANNMRIQILNQEAAIGKTEKEIRNYSQSLEALESSAAQAENEIDDLADSLDDVGDSAKDAEGGFTILKGAISNLVSQGINAAIEGFKELMTSTDQAFNTFQAQTGKSSEEVKVFNEQIKELYKANYGESLDDIAESMAKVAQSTKETDPIIIKKLTQEALILKDTFGYDVTESMRAVNMLMDQFGLTGEQAFNLIAQGAQNGLDKNDDLLDTINEYSVHFEQAGYSAEEMFNMLKNGVDEGTFSVDKLGDAFKEFGIRMKDGTADEAIRQLGLSVEDTTSKFAEGGEKAKKATSELIQRLFDIDDPLQQNIIGTQLFGTMWEDLGAEGIKALMSLNGEFDSTASTMAEIDAIKYNDVGSQLQQLGRTVKTELLEPFVAEILPTIKGGVEWLIQNSAIVCSAISGIGAALATLAVANIIMGLVNSFKAYKAVTEGATISQWALNAAMTANPIGLIIAAIVGLVTAIVVLWNKSDAFRGFFIGIFDTVKNTFLNFGNSLMNFITTTIPTFINNVINWFKKLPENIAQIIGLILGLYVRWNIECIKFITQTVPKWISMIIKYFSQLPGKLWSILSQAIQKAIAFAREFPTKAQKAASDFTSKLVNGVKSIPSKMLSIGRDIVKGIWNGINGMGSWLKNQISNFASNVVKGFKSAFKINSPSKLMRDTIGLGIAEGIGDGIENGESNILKTAKSLAKNVVDTMPTSYDFKRDLSVDNAINSNDLKNILSSFKVNLPESIKVNLVLDSGEVLAQVVAPFIDVIQGNNIILAERGLI